MKRNLTKYKICFLQTAILIKVPFLFITLFEQAANISSAITNNNSAASTLITFVQTGTRIKLLFLR